MVVSRIKGKAPMKCLPFLLCLEVMAIERQQIIVDELTTEALEMMSEWPSSRQKQKQFVLSYLAIGFKNATEAARQAGYSEKVANRQANVLLTKTDFLHVQKVVKKLQQEFDKRSTELSVASLLEIQQFHTRVLRGEEKDFQLVGAGLGKQVVQAVPVSLKDRQKSADSLTKMLENITTESHEEIIIVDRWQDD